MTRFPLVPHPASPVAPVTTIEVEVHRGADGSLRLCFRLAGTLDRLRLPPLQPPGRADRLWQHTCCEAFVGVQGSPAYREFNLAPSSAWAAYGFTGYRAGMAPLPADDAAIAIHGRGASGQLEFEATIPPALLPEAATGWRLGLAAVIEDDAGRVSHWALRHPDLRPDFHAPAGWVAWPGAGPVAGTGTEPAA